MVGSLFHNHVKLTKEDLANIYKPQKGFTVYSQSKLANVLFAKELAKRLEGTGVTVNSLNPGVVNTFIFKNIQEKLKFIPR